MKTLPNPYGDEDSYHSGTAPAVPYVTLTFPTPDIPSEAAMAPQLPFGLSVRSVVDLSPVPSLATLSQIPRCTQHDLFSENCQACEQHALARRIWDHSCSSDFDDLNTAFLREPFVRPAESTRKNRTLVKMMGLPVGSAKAVGSAIDTDPEGCDTMSSAVSTHYVTSQDDALELQDELSSTWFAETPGHHRRKKGGKFWRFLSRRLKRVRG